MSLPTYRHSLTYNSTTKVLGVSPGGYKTADTNFFRSKDYFGISRSIALSQRYFKVEGDNDLGAYQFILDALDSEGIKAQITYTKEKLNPYTQAYDSNYVGLLDLTPGSGFTHDRSERFIEANTIDTSKQQYVNANDEKEYDLSSLIATNGNTISAFSDCPKASTFKNVNLYLQALTSGNIDIDANILFSGTRTDIYDYDYSINDVGDRLIDGEVKVYENSTEEAIEITLDIEGTYNTSFAFTQTGTPFSGTVDQVLTVILHDDLGAVVTTYTYFDEGATFPVNESYSGSISDSNTFTIQPDYYLTFKLVTTSAVENVSIRIISDFVFTQFDITEKYSDADRVRNTWLTFEMFTRLFQLMTGETDTSKLLDSSIFGRTDSEFTTYSSDGALAYLATINGSVLRQSLIGKTKTSFKNAFKAITNMANIAMWYDIANEVYRIEDKESVFKDTEVFDLGEVTNFKEVPYNDAYFSQIFSGSDEKGVYEDLQGANEYNIQSEHSVNMPVSTKLPVRCSLNNDTVGITLALRAPYSTTGKTDTKQDDKTYIVELDSDLETIVNSDIGTFTGFKGVDEYYNGNYTPRTCLKNNGNWIASQLDKDSSGTIQFVSNSKDVIISRLGVSEDSSISKSDLGVPLYFPNKYTIEFNQGSELITQMETDPHGYFKFTHKGESFYGYWIEGSVNDYTQKGEAILVQANINR